MDKVLKLNKTTPALNEGEMFSFYSLSAKKQKEVEKLFRELQSVVTLAIRKGVELEWATANKECDAFISSTFGKDLSQSKEVAAWYERNTDAMEEFINRSDNGLNLSDRIWKNVQQLRDEMEVAMTVSIGEGGSAATTSRKVRQYLNDPDLMFKRFRFKKGEEDILDEDGNVIGTKPIWGKKWKKRIKDEKTGKYKFIDYDRDSYKVGRGMYKSAARNAMRVARTETTMAYRQADHERWQQLDFVLGQEVKLSESHPAEDICNTLAGRYPKDFNFCGWHPQCFCYVVPITLSTEESLKIANEIANGRDYQPLLDDLKQGKEIDSYPKGFTKWIEKNQGKIASSKSLPYFVKYNKEAVKEVVTKEEPKEKSNIQSVADAVGVEKKAESMVDATTTDNAQMSSFRNAKKIGIGSFDPMNLSDVQYKSEKGGNVSVNASRLENANKSKQEFEKFKKEHHMCRVLADNGYNIEMLEEKPGVSSSDILINGIKADLKSTRSAANIVKYAKKAVQKQDAELVIFEFENETEEIYKQLQVLKSKDIKCKYYFQGRDKIYDL